jgi:hypothetical protein
LGAGACFRHGGCTRHGRKHAQRLLAKQAAESYGLPREVDPQTALLEEVHRSAGAVAWLETEIRGSTKEDLLTGGRKEHRIEIEREGEWVEHGLRRVEVTIAPSVLLELYQKERRHLVDVCKTCITCGLAERQVKMAEQQGQLIAAAFEHFTRLLAGDFGFDPEAEPVKKAAREALLLVANDGEAA